MPDVFAAGSTVVYTRSDESYTAADGWTMKLYISGPSNITPLAGVVSGRSFVFTLSAAITAKLDPGPYDWSERAHKTGTPALEYVVESGKVEVMPDIRQATAGSMLSWEARMLPLVEAALQVLMTTGVQAYQIGTGSAVRSFTKADIGRLMRIRDNLKTSIRAAGRPGKFGMEVRASFTGYESE